MLKDYKHSVSIPLSI